MLIVVFSLVCLVLAVPVGLNAGFWAALGTFVGVFLLQALLMFLFLLYLCSRVDQNVPQEKDDPLYRTVTDLILESVLPILRIHIHKTGMEKVPQQGRFLLVCRPRWEPLPSGRS